MNQRTPKLTLEHLFRTLPGSTHDDLTQLLIVTDNAREVLAELERSQAIIHELIQCLTTEQKFALTQKFDHLDLIGDDGGIFRTNQRIKLIDRSRRIQGDAK